jgi:hypothetical protein
MFVLVVKKKKKKRERKKKGITRKIKKFNIRANKKRNKCKF